MTTKCVLSGLLVLALLAPARAGAGEDPARGERARTYLVLRITDALGLSDEKALEISRILRRSGETRQQLRRERGELQSPLRAAVEAGDEKALADLVARANELDRKLSLLASESFLQVQEVLSPVERGKLVLLVPELQDQLRSRRGWRRGEGPDPRGRGSGQER
jgi:hypothetical protein